MILRNALTRTLAGVTTVLAGIFTTPILTRYLGQQDFGLWLLLMSVGAYLGILDLGLTTALTKHLAGELALGRRQRARQFFSGSLLVYGLLALLVLAVYLGLWVFCGEIFHLASGQVAKARWLFLVLGLPVALAFPARACEALLLAAENHYVLGMVEAASNFLRLGLILLVFWLGGRLYALAFLHASVVLAGFVALAAMAWRLSPEYLTFRPRWEARRLGELWAYVRQFFLSIVGESTRNQAPTLLLGAGPGPVEVARFGVGNRIALLAQNLLCTGLGVSMSRFAALHARGDFPGLGELLGRVSLHAALLAAYLGMGLWFFGGPFILLWVGPQYQDSVRVVQILALPMACHVTVFPCVLALQGLGRLKLCGGVYLAEAGLAAAACWFLGNRYGAVGAAAGLGGSILLLRPWLLAPHACRLIRLPLGRYLERTLWRPGLAAAAAGLGWWWWSPAAPSGWGGLLLQGMAYSLWFALCGWFLGLDAGLRRLWRDKLGGWLKRLARRGAGG